MAKNIYIGKRYVPLIVGNWDNTKNTSYESLSVVTYGGDSYTSKRDVPIGIDLNNLTYWIKSGEYNLQVAQYKEEVENYVISSTQEINANSDDIVALQNGVGTLNTQFSTVSALPAQVTALTTSVGALNTEVDALPRTIISTLNPTASDGNNGDVWIKYIDLIPTAVDSLTITLASTVGATVKANKATVPQYWDIDNVEGVITFNVYLDGSTTPYGNYTWAQISAGVAIVGQAWTAGTIHTATVKTKSITSSKTDYSNAISGTFTPLAYPSGVTSANGNFYVNLSWLLSTGATSYNVKRSTTNGSGYVTIATGVTALTYSDGSVANGTTYYYVISAVNINGESVNSSQVVGIPQIIQAQWLQWEMADNATGVLNGTNVYMEIGEIEVNSPDITPSTDASWSAYSTFGAGYEASKVADGVVTDTNRWVSGTTSTPQWIKVNLGSLQAINSYRVNCGINISTFPKNVKVYKSILATPSAKVYGVANADWVLVNTVVWINATGWSSYIGFNL